MEDVASGAIGGPASEEPPEIPEALNAASVVSWEAWEKVNQEEEARGAPKGKPREKIVDAEALLRTAEVLT